MMGDRVVAAMADRTADDRRQSAAADIDSIPAAPFDRAAENVNLVAFGGGERHLPERFQMQIVVDDAAVVADRQPARVVRAETLLRVPIADQVQEADR